MLAILQLHTYFTALVVLTMTAHDSSDKFRMISSPVAITSIIHSLEAHSSLLIAKKSPASDSHAKIRGKPNAGLVSLTMTCRQLFSFWETQ
jgi:hypothetical protein